MTTPAGRTHTTPLEALTVTGMTFGMFIVMSIQAVANDFPERPFSDQSMLWMVVVELMIAVAAISFLHLRGFAVHTLQPIPTLKGAAVGVVLYAAATLIGSLVALPFSAGETPQPIETMVVEATLSIPIIVLMAMINGSFEEVFLLGFLLRGLRAYGASVALSVTLLVRLLCHLYQGPIGPIWVMGFGVVLGVYYLRTGNLWPAVFAHILGDIVPFG